MKRAIFGGILLAATAIATLGALTAQEISVELVATVGEADGPGAIGAPTEVVRLPSGHLVVVSNGLNDQLTVFDSSGIFSRTVGRRGSGPGEFEYVAALFVDRAGRLHVVDRVNARRTVYGQDLELLSTEPFVTPVLDFAVVEDDVVVAADIRLPQIAGNTVHLLGPDGDVSLSFGEDPDPIRRGEGAKLRRTIVPTRDGTFWAVHRTRYQLDHWNLGGQLLTSHRRSEDWFEPHGVGLRVIPDQPPRPNILAATMIPSGHILLATVVPDSRWESALGQGAVRDGRRSTSIEDHIKWLDTMLDIIDPATGEVIARKRIDAYVFDFADATHAAAIRTDQGGAPVVDIFRVQFDSPE